VRIVASLDGGLFNLNATLTVLTTLPGIDMTAIVVGNGITDAETCESLRGRVIEADKAGLIGNEQWFVEQTSKYPGVTRVCTDACHGCCAPSPCMVSKDDVICAVCSLLPEGEIYNNTRVPFDALTGVVVAVTVGCSKVGYEQLILGGCGEEHILCTGAPVAPQLAVIDSFGAVVYGVVEALCRALRELDPCSSDLTLQFWVRRFGLVTDDPCGLRWSDDLQELAGYFGGSLARGGCVG
jgi:hypothetical protein